MTTTKRIFAVSDLHLGAPASVGEPLIHLIKKDIRASTDTVLCGDIFEGAIHKQSLESRIELAKKALNEWSEAANKSGTTIHLLMGNHEEPLLKPDVVPPADGKHLAVAKAVREHVKTLPNVIFHESGSVKIGDAFFTHGHLQLDFRERIVGPFQRMLERPLHLIAPGWVADTMINPREDKIDTMHESLNDDPEVKNSDVRHVVFGHTHAPMQSHAQKSLKLGKSPQETQYHNLGCATHGRMDAFQPLVIEQNEDGFTTRVRPAQCSALHETAYQVI